MSTPDSVAETTPVPPAVPKSPAEAFVHLHVHSEYSMLRATPRIGGLIQAAQAMGQTALALTDHGNMLGMLELYTSAEKAGIKQGIGRDTHGEPGARTHLRQ